MVRLTVAACTLVLVTGAPAWADLAASILPASRSVQVGGLASAFATLINTASTPAVGCRIAPTNAVPATFAYQATDPTTNRPIGAPNTPVTIAGRTFQTFVVSFVPSGSFGPVEMAFDFSCSNAPSAPIVSGVNTLLLSASSQLVPDVVALGATVTGDGVITLPSAGSGAFSVAAVNLGSAGQVTVTADTGSATLPLSMTVCQTNPATGACIGGAGTTISSSIGAGATPTFAVFSQARGVIPFAPGTSRIFLRFRDPSGAVRGATSIAVRATDRAIVSGSFSGRLSASQGTALSVDDTIDLTISPGSGFGGTFFRRGAANVATFSGVRAGASAVFNGSSGGDCPDSFTGSMTPNDDGTVAMALRGNNCNGPFGATGLVSQQPCLQVAGTYRASESGTVTCTVLGQSGTQGVSGEGMVALAQNGCDVSYVVPGSSISRQGTIAGNALSMTGPLAVALSGNVQFQQNRLTVSGQVVNPNKITATGTGIATGTVEGVPFSCTGNTTAVFNRCFRVAVAVLRGGVVGAFEVDSALDRMRTQALHVDEDRVIARGFAAGDQLRQVRDWIASVSSGCPQAPRIILVGHSLGGDAVRQATLGNMCSRITLDPIIAPVTQFNQRDLSAVSFSGSGGRFINKLASTTDDVDGQVSFGLLGRHISNAEEEIISVTNHMTLPTAVLDRGLVASETQRCLNQ